MKDGEGGGAGARDDHARWLSQTMSLLEGLLNAAQPPLLEAFRAYRVRRDEVSVSDLAAARQLLLLIVGSLDGTRDGWDTIAMALDATLPEDAPAPRPLARKAAAEDVDRTLPAVAPPMRDVTDTLGVPVTDAGPATHPPPVEAIDDTIALGEMKALDLDPSTGQAASAAIPSAVLDLDRYAVLCAWTQLHPERREALHRQYGLESEAQRRALDAHFEQLFERDAELRAAFAHRLRMHVGYLGAGRG